MANATRNFCVTPDACTSPIYARGKCKKHYQWAVRHGLQTAPGKGAPGAKRIRKATSHVSRSGYRRVKREDDGTWDMEHRVVMERVIGRRLLPDENVHHRNGIRLDNHPDNLELWVTSQPSGQRVEDILPWAREMIARYG